MKKHIYRAKKINQISIETLSAQLGESKAIVSVDVAKRDFAVGSRTPRAGCSSNLNLRIRPKRTPVLSCSMGLSNEDIG